MRQKINKVASLLPQRCHLSFPSFPVVLILAPGAAKGGVGVTAQEHFPAVLAQPQGMFIVHQHKAEHHLDAEQQEVKIPVGGVLS